MPQKVITTSLSIEAARKDDQAPTQFAILHALVGKPLILVPERQQPFSAFGAEDLVTWPRTVRSSQRPQVVLHRRVLSIETTTMKGWLPRQLQWMRWVQALFTAMLNTSKASSMTPTASNSPRSSNHGYIAGFLIPGETPMLTGRPILEALGLTINFQKKLMMWDHGEYLLPLTSDFRPEMLHQSPAFDLVLADSALADTEEPYTVDLETYMNVEAVSQDSGHSPVTDGSRMVILKDWKRMNHVRTTTTSHGDCRAALRPTSSPHLGSLCRCLKSVRDRSIAWLQS